ncbi:hypothetical protein A3Q56_05005, partial [Intoshia linei]
MSDWTNLKKPKKYVALYNFDLKNDESCIQMLMGDVLSVLKKTKEWFYGLNLRTKKKGIFPINFVDKHRIGSINFRASYDNTLTSQTSLIQLVMQTVREWYAQYDDFIQYSVDHNKWKAEAFQMNIIDNILEIYYKDLIKIGFFTKTDINILMWKIIKLIDNGNINFKLDLQVRDDEGRVLDPTITSVVTLFRQSHKMMEFLNSDDSQIGYNITRQEDYTQNFASICVNIVNVIFPQKYSFEIIITLYDKSSDTLISEPFIIELDSNGTTKDGELLGSINAVFKDIHLMDWKLENLYFFIYFIRIGPMFLKKNAENLTNYIRRPVGVAVHSLKYIADYNDLRSLTEFNELRENIYECLQSVSLEDNCKKIINNELDVVRTNDYFIFINIKLKKDQLADETLPNLNNLTVVKKLKMSIIDKFAERNDVYVKLVSAEFKKSDYNVECTIEVWNGDKLVDLVIKRGADSNNSNKFTSTVYHHEAKPIWNEYLCLSLDPSEIDNYVLKLKFQHRSSTESKDQSRKPFGYAFMRLGLDSKALTSNGLYQLMIYKHESKKNLVNIPIEAMKNLKIFAPPISTSIKTTFSDAQKLILRQNYLSPSSDVVCISITNSSTVLTNNKHLIIVFQGSIKLNNAKTVEIIEILNSIESINSDDKIKHFKVLMDCLLRLISSYNLPADILQKIFHSILGVILSMIEIQNKNARSLIETYIDEEFYLKNIHFSLLTAIKNEFARGEFNSMLKTGKCMRYLLRLIISSKKNLDLHEEDMDFKYLIKLMSDFFNIVKNIMEDKHDKNVYKMTILRYIPETIKDLALLFDAEYISEWFFNLLVPVLNMCEYNLQIMISLETILESPLFHKYEDVEGWILLAFELSISSMSELNEKISADIDGKYRSTFEISIRLLSDVIDRYEERFLTNLSPLFYRLLYKHLGKMVNITMFLLNSVHDVTKVNMYVVLLTILRLMSERSYLLYVKNTQDNVHEFFLNILSIFHLTITKNLFSDRIHELHMIQNSIIFDSMVCISDVMLTKQYGIPSMWKLFFTCALEFATQHSIQLHLLPESKSLRIMSRYDDYRISIAYKIRNIWNSIGTHRKELIKDILYLVIKVSMIPVQDVRSAVIPIIFDLMNEEFSRIVPESNAFKGNFEELEYNMFNHFRILISQGFGQDDYILNFEKIISTLFEKAVGKIREKGLQFIERIKTIYTLLVQLYQSMKSQAKFSIILAQYELL